MRSRSAILAAVLLASSPALFGYVRETFRGQNLLRGNFSRFSVDPKVLAGLRNASGAIVITPESDPVAALTAAMHTWSSVPGTAVDVELTVSQTYGPAMDFVNTISFDDTDSTRSAVGSAIAVTLNTYTISGLIVDSDIVFNPGMQFATAPTLGCFDLQSIATHELGHTLGAGHSVLSSATMFAYFGPEDTWPRQLSTDDVAFISDAFPAGSPLGVVAGTLAYSTGKPVLGALVLVINPDTGFVVAPYAVGAGYSTGGLPPGNYLIAALPVAPYLTGDSTLGFDTPDWQATFYGGASPQTIAVVAGQIALADITVPDGAAKLRIDFAEIGGGAGSTSLIPSGIPVPIQLFGRGFTDSIRPEDIVVYGPGVSVQADSVRVTPSTDPNMSSTLSFTAGTAPQPGWPDAVVTVRSGGSVAVYGGVRMMPAGPQFTPSGVANAASIVSGPVAPGEIVSLFGSAIGPDQPSIGTLDASGRLVTSLGDTAVEFDGQPAPLFYVSSVQINAQVPFEVAPKTSTLVRVKHGGASSEVILPVAAASPAIFGGYSQPAVLNQDGTLNTYSNPAPPGSTVVVFGTGQGLVDPPLSTGAAAPVRPLSRFAQVSATVADLPARVDFAGMAPGFVGLTQLNIVVPEATPSGQAPLRLTVNGVSQLYPPSISIR